MTADSSEADTYRLQPYEPGDESSIVAVLSACLAGWEGKGPEHWAWEHSSRPGFRLDDVLTVRLGDRVVGCFHSAVLPLRLDRGLEVLVSYDGDFAILPEHRGKGIPTRAHDLMDARLLAEGVVFRGGFTSGELNQRFYGRYGYRFIPTDTVDYRKVLGWEPVRHLVEGLGERLMVDSRLRARLEEPVCVELRIDGLPDAHVVLGPDGWRLAEGSAHTWGMAVEAPYQSLAAAFGGGFAGMLRLVPYVLAGRLRVIGLTRHIGLLATLVRAALHSRFGRRR